jgi:hypothetical protein
MQPEPGTSTRVWAAGWSDVRAGTSVLERHLDFLYAAQVLHVPYQVSANLGDV